MKRLTGLLLAALLAFNVAAQVTTNPSVTGAFNPASPGAIGGTTPAAGSFSTLTVNSGTAIGSLTVGTAWTPTLGGNATYSTNSGFYTRIGTGATNGTMVTANFRLNVSSIGTGSTTTISGLPSPGANSNIPYGGACHFWTGLAITPVYVAPQVSGQTITFNAATAASATLTGSSAIFGTGAGVYCTVTYFE